MRVLIDADACPVTDRAVRMAAERGVESVLFCDDAHWMARDDAQVVTVMRGADSADFALINRCTRGDIVVTQDYALAAMALACAGAPSVRHALYAGEYHRAFIHASRDAKGAARWRKAARATRAHAGNGRRL